MYKDNIFFFKTYKWGFFCREADFRKCEICVLELEKLAKKKYIYIYICRIYATMFSLLEIYLEIGSCLFFRPNI